MYKRIIIDDNFTDYLINSEGFVISLNYKRSGKYSILKEVINKKSGYHHVAIHSNKKEYRIKVHRLVAEAFIPKIPGKNEVNHIYSPNKKDKYDNSIHNLEWVTPKENMLHARKNGLLQIGKNHYNYKYDDKITKKICKLLEKNELTMHAIADKCKVEYSFVVAIKTKKIRTEISDKYDINHYSVKESKVKGDNYKGRNHFLSFNINQLEDACKLFQNTNKTVLEVSKQTGIGYSTLCNIYHKRIKNKVVMQIINKYKW